MEKNDLFPHYKIVLTVKQNILIETISVSKSSMSTSSNRFLNFTLKNRSLVYAMNELDWLACLRHLSK